MPALGTITINDGESTPVAHAFAPVTTDGARAKLANRSATSPLGFETLAIEVIEPKSAGQAYAVRVTGYDPVIATVDGTDQVVRFNSFELKMNFSGQSSAQERKNARVMLQNLLANATMVTVIESLEPIY